MANDQQAKGKSREELLREETRFWMDTIIKQMQWGLTLLVSIETALIFVRRELLTSFISAGMVKPGDLLPYHRYLIGTFFLFGAAVILWALTNRSVQQYRHYKGQLVGNNNPSGIVDQAPTGISKWIGFFYFAFPLMDVAFRFWVEFSDVKIH